jgi:hypothetical protein
MVELAHAKSTAEAAHSLRETKLPEANDGPWQPEGRLQAHGEEPHKGKGAQQTLFPPPKYEHSNARRIIHAGMGAHERLARRRWTGRR